MSVNEEEPPFKDLVREVRFQCEFVLFGMRMVNGFYQYFVSPAARVPGPEGVATMRMMQNQLWFALQGIASAVGAIHGILANSKSVRDALGAKAIEEEDTPQLTITEPAVLARMNQIRNHMLHPEQRLRRWKKGRGYPSIGVRNIGPLPVMQSGNVRDLHLNYDPAKGLVSFWGQEVNIQDLTVAVEDLWQATIDSGVP